MSVPDQVSIFQDHRGPCASERLTPRGNRAMFRMSNPGSEFDRTPAVEKTFLTADSPAIILHMHTPNMPFSICGLVIQL